MSSPKNKRKIQRQSLPHREKARWEKLLRRIDVMYNKALQKDDAERISQAIDDLKIIIREKAEDRSLDIQIEMSGISKEYLIDKSLES